MIRVETLLSRMAGHARLKPMLMADTRVLPLRSSSFMRSNISMLASTAMPTESIVAATPDSVRVTVSLYTANTRTAYISRATAAITPGRR